MQPGGTVSISIVVMLWLAGLIPGLVPVVARAQTAPQVAAMPTMTELHEAARREGTVAFGGALKEDDTAKLVAVFSQRYPGVAVQYTRRSTQPMVQLIEADRLAGRVSFDLVNITEPGELVRWIKDGFLASVPMPDSAVMLPEAFDANGHFYALGLTPMLGIYNTDKLKPAEAPRSLKVLLTDRAWIGKVVHTRPTRGGTSAAALMNVVAAAGHDVIASIKQRRILLTLSNEATIDAVSSGERPVSWGVSGYRALEARADGAPIGLIVWDEGVPLAQFIAAVPVKAPHPNAARLLLRWLMSKEGQELIVKHARCYSARRDVEATPLGEPKLTQMRINAFSNDKVVAEGQALAIEYDKAVGLQ